MDVSVRSISRPAEEAKPFFKLTPGLALKTVASVVLTTMGMYYLAQGKKYQDINKMILGAALILGGVFVYL